MVLKAKTNPHLYGREKPLLEVLTNATLTTMTSTTKMHRLVRTTIRQVLGCAACAGTGTGPSATETGMGCPAGSQVV